jgi:hypothetical protein
MKNLSEEILKEIEEKKITPKSRFSLRWKQYLYWLILVIMGCLAVMSISLLLLSVSVIDREVLRDTGLGIALFIFMRSLPIVWILLLSGSLLLGFLLFTKIRYSYRYKRLFVFFLSLTFLLLISVMLHVSAMNREFEERFGHGLPPHFRSDEHLEKRFHIPEQGMISGRIVSLGASYCVIELPDTSTKTVLINEQTRLPRRPLQENISVRILCEECLNDEVTALKIAPLKRKGYR